MPYLEKQGWSVGGVGGGGRDGDMNTSIRIHTDIDTHAKSCIVFHSPLATAPAIYMNKSASSKTQVSESAVTDPTLTPTPVGSRLCRPRPSERNEACSE